MKFIPSLFLTAALLAAPLVHAMNAVMYQPQLRDMSMTDGQWQTMLHQLKMQGIDTLVLQWSRYGDAFRESESRSWLEHKAKLARDSNMKLVLGLAADEHFFARQKQPLAARENYLNLLRADDVAVAKRWVEVLGQENIAGWYISGELDDLNWRTPQMQQAALDWLSKTRRSLAQVADKPVAVSSFFSGNMAPESWSKWVGALNQSGVKMWVQDGSGTQTLPPAVRELYMRAPAAGQIVELFRQQKQATGFSATALATPQQHQWLATPLPAGQDRIYFSLRYMDVAQGVLQF